MATARTGPLTARKYTGKDTSNSTYQSPSPKPVKQSKYTTSPKTTSKGMIIHKSNAIGKTTKGIHGVQVIPNKNDMRVARTRNAYVGKSRSYTPVDHSTGITSDRGTSPDYVTETEPTPDTPQYPDGKPLPPAKGPHISFGVIAACFMGVLVLYVLVNNDPNNKTQNAATNNGQTFLRGLENLTLGITGKQSLFTKGTPSTGPGTSTPSTQGYTNQVSTDQGGANSTTFQSPAAGAVLTTPTVAPQALSFDAWIASLFKLKP